MLAISLVHALIVPPLKIANLYMESPISTSKLHNCIYRNRQFVHYNYQVVLKIANLYIEIADLFISHSGLQRDFLNSQEVKDHRPCGRQ